MGNKMKRISLLLLFLLALSLSALGAGDTLRAYEDNQVIDTPSLQEGSNTRERGRGGIDGEWILGGASILVALILGYSQMRSSSKMAKSTIDTNQSAELRKANEKLQKNYNNLMRQLYFMYKVEYISLLNTIEEAFANDSIEGLSKEEKEELEKKKDKAALQLRAKTRGKVETIVGYGFNSVFSRRNILNRYKGERLDKNLNQEETYARYEKIE